MDAKRIEQWIEKYFDANLSIDEERELVSMLTTTEVPTHLERDKQLILSLHADATKEHATAMQRLSAQIDEWEVQESRPIRRQLITRLWRAASIAACTLLVIGVSLRFNRSSTPRDTFDTPEEAYTATYEALLALSSALNKGYGYVAMAMATGERVECNVSQQIEKLKQFDDNN
ncbi:MAG: hypothetical protein IKV15_05330 [Bacteroidaceae bacterium]|nr:hypothetical protein [Bacteroidaceae bacterium]MBR5148600.1 hypothetical protein [Bacteroidaceae bacterium]